MMLKMTLVLHSRSLLRCKDFKSLQVSLANDNCDSQYEYLGLVNIIRVVWLEPFWTSYYMQDLYFLIFWIHRYTHAEMHANL